MATKLASSVKSVIIIIITLLLRKSLISRPCWGWMQHNGLREMVNGCDFDVANFRAAGTLPM
jgi:hypothetical protein